jgi:hypothetical protein
MEVDSECFFANQGDCDDLETPCYSLCKPLHPHEDNSFFLGAKSKMEYLLLKYGEFEMVPCNVEEFHVCTHHSTYLPATKLKDCCLCKLFGRTKSKRCSLRTITKHYAYLAWKTVEMKLSFGRKMCAQCRIAPNKSDSSPGTSDESEGLFHWLYDLNTTHTPSAMDSSPQVILSQSLPRLTIKEDQKQLKDFLRSNDPWE